MTDKEFIEMTRLFGSLTKGADTLRELFPGKVTDKVRSHPQFEVRWWLLDMADNEGKDLVGLINGCDDWTSSEVKASEIYRMMREFLSATAKMPKGISGMFKRVRSLCETPTHLILGEYPGIIPEMGKFLESESYQNAIIHKQITPPFTWNTSIKELAVVLDQSLVIASPFRILKKNDGSQSAENRWEVVDCVFWKNGEPITAKQLANALKH